MTDGQVSRSIDDSLIHSEEELPRVLYIVATNDRFELPVYTCESGVKLGRWLGIRSSSIACSLIHSAHGKAHTMDKKFRYFRIDTRTGETLVGRLPPELAGLCYSRRNGAGRGGRKEPEKPETKENKGKTKEEKQQ